jgi:hypothetical protein
MIVATRGERLHQWFLYLHQSREASMDQEFISWARKLFDAAAPHAAGTAYVNFIPGDEVDRVEQAYGSNYRRLAKVKRRYNPDNLVLVKLAPKPSAGTRLGIEHVYTAFD